MIEAVQAPATAPAPVWVRYRIGSIRATKECKFIRLINDLEKTNEEYKDTEVDISEFQTGDIIECWIHGGRLKGARFPDGMEPIKEVTKHTGKPAAHSTPTKLSEQSQPSSPQTPVAQPAKADEFQEITGDVSMLTEKGIKIGSHEMVFINGISLGDIKEGTSVKAKISGNKLIEIEKYTAPTTAPAIQGLKEDQTALKCILLDETQPHVILVNLKGEFRKTVEKEAFDQVREVQPGKLIRYSTDKTKAGNPIKSFWEVDETGKSIKPRGGGKGGRPYDPVADAKRQRLIVRQSSLERSIQVWVNGNPGKEPTPEDDDRILSRMEKYAERVMKE